MRVKTVNLYQYAELSDAAKEKARDWYRSCDAGDNSFADFVIEDAATIGAMLGIEFKTRAVNLYGGGTRQEPCIWYALGYSQSDGASFDGRYTYSKGAAKAIRKHAPTDAKLHAIADALQAAQAAHFYRLWADVSAGNRGCMTVDAYYDGRDARDIDDAITAVRDALRDFASWIYNAVRAEHEYQSADEQVAEAIIANEYEFTEAGTRCS